MYLVPGPEGGITQLINGEVFFINANKRSVSFPPETINDILLKAGGTVDALRGGQWWDWLYCWPWISRFYTENFLQRLNNPDLLSATFRASATDTSDEAFVGRFYGLLMYMAVSLAMDIMKPRGFDTVKAGEQSLKTLSSDRNNFFSLFLASG